ncbi:MAG: hypothetical protein ETSY2_15370 [Candidatus Entotheonella gemina]|uniref:Methyltransferase small domain-containing protein n=2 Tax=Candidatus Entotheonella TaxID=93171 RepID=W4MAR0_9BACT|nr:MAG: hypothetical protein ETSY2_15370 [Candidatus Entotheonella gemina]
MSTHHSKSIHSEMKQLMDRQPYSVVLNGLHLTVDEDVFPPDLGRCARNMAKLSKSYAPRRALDMGCGSGYLALMLKCHGAEEVWASDSHPAAIRCAGKNAAQNAHNGSITVVQGDLFEGIPTSIKFNLIMFNQPFGPGQGDPVCGCGPDGGYQITKRFLLEAPAYLACDGVIMMAFSDRAAPENSPEYVAKELGYPIHTLLHQFYNESNNFIYDIRLPKLGYNCGD